MRWEEGCLVISGLVASFKAEKRKFNMGDAWFRVSPLSLCLCLCLSVCLSLSLSLSHSLSLSLSLSLPDFYRLPSFDLALQSRNLSFISFFLCWSDQIGFSLFIVFNREGHGFAENWLLIIFIFWQISSTFHYELILCAEAPFFHFKESLSTDNIRWMLSLAIVAIIICMYDKLDRDLFRSYNNIISKLELKLD